MSLISSFIFGREPLDIVISSASIGAAVLYGLQVGAPPSHGRTIAKTTATALLSVATALRDGPPELTNALACGAVGDAFLAYDDGDTAFLAGLLSFLVAHLFYVLLFLKNGTVDVLDDRLRSTSALAMLVLAPLMLVLLMPRVGARLRLPVFGYSGAILAMVLLALRMANSAIVLGAVMFAASDSILSADRFLLPPTSWHRGWMQPLVWILYYSGQALIASGVLESGI